MKRMRDFPRLSRLSRSSARERTPGNTAPTEDLPRLSRLSRRSPVRNMSMNLLEVGRRALQRTRAGRNGKHPPPLPPRTYEINEKDEETTLPTATAPFATPRGSYEINEKDEVSVSAARPVRHVLVTEPASLGMVAAAIDEAPLVALDIETAGDAPGDSLDPRKGRVRLLSVAADTIAGEPFAYLIDCFHVDPRPLFGLLAERPLVGHNLQFDLTFLARLGFEPGAVHDTMLLSQLLHGPRKGRGFHSLAQTAERELGQVLSKELQRSDWSGTLSEAQLE